MKNGELGERNNFEKTLHEIAPLNTAYAPQYKIYTFDLLLHNEKFKEAF